MPRARRRARWLALASSVAAIGMLHPALADPVTLMGNVTSTPYGQPMDPMPDLLTSDLHVGDTGQGSMLVQDGGWAFTNEYANIGHAGGSQGDVTITGAGSRWDAFELRVGNGGTGSLTIADGGLLQSAWNYNLVGAESGSQGTVTVTGASSTWNTDALYVGYAGNGSVSITDGGTVGSLLDGVIAYNAGTTGTVAVTGDDSRWTLGPAADLYVGYSGNATLTIDGTSAVTSRQAFVGYAAGSTGTVTVTGNGKMPPNTPTGTWSQSDKLYVGTSGNGQLSIQNGGFVATYGETYVGFRAGSTGIVTVTGDGSSLYQQGGMEVGSSGRGTLTIADGAWVFTDGGSGIIGSAGGSTGTVTVTGQGTQWQINNRHPLLVGYGGHGTLTIEDGASVSTNSTTIGGSGLPTGGNAGGDVTVTDEGSLFKGGTIDLGYGASGTLTVENGGVVQASNILMGFLGSAGTLNINGTDGARGVVETANISTIQGFGQVNFNGGILRASADGAVLLEGSSEMAALRVNILSGGAFIDTKGFNASIAAFLYGDGGLIKQGAGTLTVTGNNSYKGATQVEQGTLLWGGRAPYDNSGFVQGGQYIVNGGTLDLGSDHGILPRYPNVFALTMSSLSGSGGTVKLNTGDLIVDQAVDTAYAGSITGTGGLEKSGVGSLTLGGDSTYSGRTIITGGTLAVNGSIVSDVFVGSGGTLAGTGTVGGSVLNIGTVAPGNSIGTLTVVGDLTQQAGGVLVLESDFAGGRIDRLAVGGDAALDGRVEVRATTVLPDVRLPFLTAGGALSHSLNAPSSIFDYAVTQEGNALSVSAASAHFAEPGFGLDHDQGKVAAHLQDAWEAGGGALGTLFGTLGTLADDDPEGYAGALSDLSPGVAGAAAAGSIATTQQHLDTLLSCPVFAAGTSFLTETECAWGQAGGQALDQKADGGISGFDTTTYSLQAGMQREVSPDWFVGFAGGYDRSSTDSDDGRVESDGDIVYGGAVLKHQSGPWLLSGAVAGSYGWYDSTRTIAIPGFAGQAEGDPEVYNLSARFRTAYTMAQGDYYLRPLVDFDLIYSHASGYRESGAGLLDLAVDDSGQWSFHATPALEVGTRVALNETTVMRAFAAAGVSFGSADSWETTARLANAPAGTGSFDSEFPLAQVVGRLTAGVDLAADNGFGLRVNYQGSFSDTYTSHGGALRLSYRF